MLNTIMATLFRLLAVVPQKDSGALLSVRPRKERCAVYHTSCMRGKIKAVCRKPRHPQPTIYQSEPWCCPLSYSTSLKLCLQLRGRATPWHGIAWRALWQLSQMAKLRERVAPWVGTACRALWQLSQMAKLRERGTPWHGTACSNFWIFSPLATFSPIQARQKACTLYKPSPY